MEEHQRLGQMNEGQIELHPEAQRLAAENDLLREELATLLAEAHDLVHTTRPNLIALYQTKLGAWELRLLRVQCAVARLRREIELIQASLNRSERPNLVAINGQLELEFLQWQQKVQDAGRQIQAAEARLQHLLPPEQDRELKRLYHALVKRLHPDVAPSLTADQKRLWQRVQTGYERGDLTELRALALLAEADGHVPAPGRSLDTLRADRAILEQQIQALLAQIASILRQPPFTEQALLEDEAGLSARRQAIELQIEQVETQRAALEAHLNTLLPADRGTFFGQN